LHKVFNAYIEGSGFKVYRFMEVCVGGGVDTLVKCLTSKNSYIEDLSSLVKCRFIKVYTLYF
jgi:hypothetical protein